MFTIIKYADNKALMDVIFDFKYNTALSNNNFLIFLSFFILNSVFSCEKILL